MNKEYFFGENFFSEFKYPDAYINFVESGNFKLIEPWWLIGSSAGLYQICHNLLNVDLESNQPLIPFAKSEETKALAFFDLEGRVYFYIGAGDCSFKNLDWGSRFHLTHFNDWLEKVKSGDI